MFLIVGGISAKEQKIQSYPSEVVEVLLSKDSTIFNKAIVVTDKAVYTIDKSKNVELVTKKMTAPILLFVVIIPFFLIGLFVGVVVTNK